MSTASPRHFLSLLDFSRDELAALFRRAAELKSLRAAGTAHRTLESRVLGLVFEKASTRSRCAPSPTRRWSVSPPARACR